MVTPQTTKVSHSGITDAYDATTVRYDACMIKPVARWAPTIFYGLKVMMVMTFGDNVLFI